MLRKRSQSIRTTSLLVTGFVACLARVDAEEAPASPGAYWPHWRGPAVDGVAPHGDPPVEWSESKNVRSNDGYLSCLDAATGKEHYVNQKLEGIGTVYASLAGARDRLYVIGKNGTSLVIQQGPKYQVLSSNVLEDNFTASPAIVGRELYLRGHKHLYCLGRERAE